MSFIVDAPADGWVWVDRAWWPAWHVTVDGVGQTSMTALGGQLLRVGPGRREIRMTLMPWDAALGLVAGLGAVVIALVALIVIRRHRRRPTAEA